jgi:serine protease
MFCSAAGYNALSGTSMASPHVAGVAALLVKHGIADVDGNGRTNDEVAEQLCATTTPGAPGAPPDPSYHHKYGCGVVNAFNAVVSNPFTGTGSGPSATFTSPALGTTVTSSSSTNTVTWTEDDGGSGAQGRWVTLESGPVVTAGTCAGVTWTSAWTESHTSPFTTGGYALDSCYRFTLTITNVAGGSATVSSGDLLIEAGPPPPPAPNPSATFTSPALGTTVTSSSSTNTVTWTEDDGGGGGIASRSLTLQRGRVVSAGTCAGVTWTSAWTESHTSPFTTGGYKTGWCYRFTLTITNVAGGSATVSSGDLLRVRNG